VGGQSGTNGWIQYFQNASTQDVQGAGIGCTTISRNDDCADPGFSERLTNGLKVAAGGPNI